MVIVSYVSNMKPGLAVFMADYTYDQHEFNFRVIVELWRKKYKKKEGNWNHWNQILKYGKSDRFTPYNTRYFNANF